VHEFAVGDGLSRKLFCAECFLVPVNRSGRTVDRKVWCYSSESRWDRSFLGLCSFFDFAFFDWDFGMVGASEAMD